MSPSKFKAASARLGFALLLGAVAFPALAQAPVATAGDSATDRQITAWLADDGDGNTSDAPAAAGAPAPVQDRAIHGEAEVGFGSNGYRLARVSAVAPIGEDAVAGVALADASIGGRSFHAERRSFALSLRIGQDGASGVEPCGVRHTGVRLASDLRRDALCPHLTDDTAALP